MMGAKSFVALADRLRDRHGERFAAPALLREMAAEGKRFYDGETSRAAA
jgi:3-hydroxyacyl-CoA dehydrogenase/enoyl-CoA hydratase/3-hydroxybutyryl-CoA epimerase